MALAHPFCAGLPILLAHFCALTHHHPADLLKNITWAKSAILIAFCYFKTKIFTIFTSQSASKG